MKHLKLFENYINYNNKDLVIVDIQPEYESVFKYEFNISSFTNFLNENHEMFNSIKIFWNGEDLGMISEEEYMFWLVEHGLEEDVLDSIEFIEKGYAFFRYCIDSGIDDDITVNLIKYMIENDINDSREIEEDTWDDLIEFYDSEDVDMSDVRELLEHSDDMINIPDLMEDLKHLTSGNILLTGGHVEECLREVVLALKALEKDYELLEEFTY